MAKLEKFPFKIQAIDECTYEMQITLNAEKKQFDLLLSKVLPKLQKARPDVAFNGAEGFKQEVINIPQQYLKLIKVAIRKPYMAVKEEIKADPIELISYHVDSCKFVKQPSGGYNIEVFIWGSYKNK